MSNAIEFSGDLLRAQSWDEYVGQTKMKARLSLHIRAANAKEATLDHIFLDGPPGMGKTTIAQIVAATGWLPHTVRGAFAGALKKKLGLTVTSEKIEGGERTYRIAAE